jgi:pyruvate/2-oxoglutarate dehydrogenase complex dihydrolipoamide acyltransferase (E2) component
MRCSIIISINTPVDMAVVKDGKIVIAPVAKINATIDHRFLDGGRAKAILEAITDVFANPTAYAQK